MAQQAHESSDQQPLSARAERAHRILDAAAQLVGRWGYNKTTIDDIAKQAGVGKGTIYLHWKSREDLFQTLLRREQLEMGRDLRQRVASNPNGATLRGIFQQTALALIRRPLMMAFILRDTEVLGKFARTEQNNATYVERLAGFKAYLDFLGQYNLIRKDLDARAQVVILSAIFMGFFMIGPLMPGELTLSDDEIASLIGETIYRALESGHIASAEELNAISAEFLTYVDRGLALAEDQFRRELDS